MLDVRRPSVTTALHPLEGKLLIRYDRGWVKIRDSDNLEEFAGDACTASPKESIGAPSSYSWLVSEAKLSDEAFLLRGCVEKG